ncbi:hypothetical protein Tco_0622369 [Tanacetum coccineum]
MQCIFVLSGETLGKSDEQLEEQGEEVVSLKRTSNRKKTCASKKKITFETYEDADKEEGNNTNKKKRKGKQVDATVLCNAEAYEVIANEEAEENEESKKFEDKIPQNKMRKGKKAKLVKAETNEGDKDASESNEEPPLRKKKLDAPCFVDARKLKGDMLVLKGAKTESKKAFVGDKRKKDNVEEKKETDKKKVAAAGKPVSVKRVNKKLMKELWLEELGLGEYHNNFNFISTLGALGMWIAKNYDPEEHIIKMVDGRKIKVTRELIHEILDVLMGEREVNALLNTTSEDVTTTDYRSSIGFIEERINISKVEDHVSSLIETGWNFKVNFLVIFFSILAQGNKDETVNLRFIPRLKDIDELKSYDCLTVSPTTVVERKAPIFKHWSTELLKKRQVEELKNRGFGQLPILEEIRSMSREEELEQFKSKIVKIKALFLNTDDKLKIALDENLEDSDLKMILGKRLGFFKELYHSDVDNAMVVFNKGYDVPKEAVKDNEVSKERYDVLEKEKDVEKEMNKEKDVEKVVDQNLYKPEAAKDNKVSKEKDDVPEKENDVEKVVELDCETLEEAYFPSIRLEDIKSLKGAWRNLFDEKSTVQDVNEDDMILQYSLPNLPFLSTQEVSCLEIDTQKSPQIQKQGIPKYFHSNKLKLPKYVSTDAKAIVEKQQEEMLTENKIFRGKETKTFDSINNRGRENVPKTRAKKTYAYKQDIKKPQVRKQTATQLAKSKETKAKTVKPEPTKRKKREPNDKEETAIHASPISFIPSPVDTKSEKHQGKASNFLVSPFYQWKVILHEPFSKEGKKIVEYIWSENTPKGYITHYLTVYVDLKCTVINFLILHQRVGIECVFFLSLYPEIQVASTIIDLWTLVLNNEEQHRDKLSGDGNVYCLTVMMTHHSVEMKNFDDVNLVFFPAIKMSKISNHFYVICFNLKTSGIKIIDNIDNGIDDIKIRYGGFLYALMESFIDYLERKKYQN